MIYDKLATIYDGLVGDKQANAKYLAFINQHATYESVLELGCGSGEIAIALAKDDKYVEASDLSEAMLKAAVQKAGSDKVNFYQQDMRDLKQKHVFDLIVCLCDSINYLNNQDLAGLFIAIYEALKTSGTFIFDMHSLDRLKEFEEEFYEAGIIDNYEYVWSITSEDDYIAQHFIIYDEDANPHYENHLQYVFDPNEVIILLKETGFEVEAYTDFDLNGIQNGEKYFLVCKKAEVVK